MQTNKNAEGTSHAETIQLDLPATHRYLNVLGVCVDALVARIEGLEQGNTLSYTVQLAVHEACTNIIDHAYADQPGGRIGIAFTVDALATPPCLIIELRDTGEPFDPASVPLPVFDEPREHGYGLFLIHQLMDDVSYTSGPGGNCCRLLKILA